MNTQKWGMTMPWCKCLDSNSNYCEQFTNVHSHLIYTIPPAVALTLCYRPLFTALEFYKILFLITVSLDDFCYGFILSITRSLLSLPHRGTPTSFALEYGRILRTLLLGPLYSRYRQKKSSSLSYRPISHLSSIYSSASLLSTLSTCEVKNCSMMEEDCGSGDGPEYLASLLASFGVVG